MTREEAISILRKWKNIGEKDMTSERLGYIEGWIHKDDLEAVAMATKALEERKEGFWDVYTDCEGKRTYYTCPFCKNKTNHFMYEPKYCDKCGARLKIEGSETDAEAV